MIERFYVTTASGIKDNLSWSLNPQGTQTTKNIYTHIKDKGEKNHKLDKDHTWIWKLHCPNKIKFFLWLCNYDRLPTYYYLKFRE